MYIHMYTHIHSIIIIIIIIIHTYIVYYLQKNCKRRIFIPIKEHINLVMRPSSLGGGRILRRTLSVCPSVRLSVRPSR